MEEPGNEVSNGNILKLKHKAWMSGSGFFLDGAARRAGRAGDGVPSLQNRNGKSSSTTRGGELEQKRRCLLGG
jgi:hypothetical protein